MLVKSLTLIAFSLTLIAPLLASRSSVCSGVCSCDCASDELISLFGTPGYGPYHLECRTNYYPVWNATTDPTTVCSFNSTGLKDLILVDYSSIQIVYCLNSTENTNFLYGELPVNSRAPDMCQKLNVLADEIQQNAANAANNTNTTKATSGASTTNSTSNRTQIYTSDLEYIVANAVGTDGPIGLVDQSETTSTDRLVAGAFLLLLGILGVIG